MKILSRLPILLLITALGLKAQETVEAVSVIEAHYQTVNLDSCDQDTVFFLFPNPRGYYPTNINPIDTTLPSSESISQFKYRVYRKFASTGALDIHILPDSLNSDTQTDSLGAYVKFLSYNADKDTLTIIKNDSLCLDLDTPDNYTNSTLQYLDWDKHITYHADLSGLLSPVPGLAIILINKTTGSGASLSDDKHKFYLSVWSQR